MADRITDRRAASASNLLATGYTSTMFAIAGLSLLACLSLLMSVRAISEADLGGPTGSGVARAMGKLRF